MPLLIGSDTLKAVMPEAFKTYTLELYLIEDNFSRKDLFLPAYIKHCSLIADQRLLERFGFVLLFVVSGISHGSRGRTCSFVVSHASMSFIILLLQCLMVCVS